MNSINVICLAEPAPRKQAIPNRVSPIFLHSRLHQEEGKLVFAGLSPELTVDS